MYRPLTSGSRRSARRGALLIAVLGLLTLFAIFALFFVFYADAEATGARIAKEKEDVGDVGPPDDYAKAAFNFTLSSILFDAPDVGGVLNSLRGHSLARSMYGFTGTAGASAPFSGLGTFHDGATPYALAGMTGGAADSAQWINFSSPFTIPSGPPAGTYFLDPEWTGYRTAAQLGLPHGDPMLLPQTYIPKNAPYTYPDLKDLIIGSPSPATGQVLVKSLHRDWLFNASNPNVQFRLAPWNPNDIVVSTNTAANIDWVTPEGRTRILRPRPVDQLTAADFANPLLGGPAPYPIQPNMANYTTPAQRTALFNVINNLIRTGQIIAYPPINADGTFTGDVQNLQGSVGVQQNDSILIDMGIAPRLWNGKWIKPLASILLTDLDGLLNLNAHGNIRVPGTPGSHASYAGYGPWEVNLGLGLGNATEANALVGLRNGGNTARNGAAWLYYDRSGSRIPAYSQVNFDGSDFGAGTGVPPSLPNFGNMTAFQTNPTFGGNTFYDDNVSDMPPESYNKYLNHPGLFNPNDWPATAGLSRTFAISDTKRFNLRYAADRDWYAQTDLFRAAGQMNASLIGSTGPGPSYRLDSAHANRMLTTMRSTSLDLPGLPGNFNTINGPAQFSLVAGLHPTNMASGSFAGGAGTDFVGPVTPTYTDNRNPRAALGPIDLNRPLADYRDLNDPLNQPVLMPLGPNNIANYPQAWADRHNLARDIFARLIVVTGAQAYVDSAGNVTLPQGPAGGPYTLTVGMNPPVPVTPGQYNALRYLAQLAANMVDYIDGDDVSTAFVWNPMNALGPTPLAQFDATTFNTVIVPNSMTMTDLPNRVVFGVEKPRLVINEAYSEAVNDPSEGPKGKGKGKGLLAMQNGSIRFWVELMNPTPPAYAGGASGVIGTAMSPGAVHLRYEVPDGVIAGKEFSPYKLEIARAQRKVGLIAGPDGSAYLTHPANVTGQFGDGAGAPYVADVTYDFRAAGANRVVGPNSTPPPNGGYSPGNVPLTSGIALVGPKFIGGMMGAGQEFDPKTTGGAQWNNMIEADYVPPVGMNPSTGMEYRPPAGDLNRLNPKDTFSDYRRNIILLRRLANPYLEPSPTTNPYITVDYMDYVYTNDALWTGMGGMAGGGEPIAERFSVGKVQPYAGYAIPKPNGMVAGLPTYNFGDPLLPYSFVQIQSPNPANASEPLHSFGRHNGRNAVAPNAQTYNAGPPATLPAGETLMAPFDWFVHFDRPIVNPLELLSLQATKPHEVTQYTIQAPAGGNLIRNLGLAPWLGVNAAGQPGFNVGPPALTNNGLYRALDLLRVKSWMYGAGLGGKVHGKININTIQDPRILQALLDGNDFGGVGNGFSSAQVGAVWTGMFNPPTPPGPLPNVPYRTFNFKQVFLADGTPLNVPMPGPTYDDVPNPSSGTFDRPYRALGAPEYAQDVPETVYTARLGSGLQDTLLRTNPMGQPLVWNSNATHPYMQAEMARKMFNNTTTTSNAFALSVTIVFHEVRLNGVTPMFLNEGAGNRYLIGKEAYKDVPGDLRQQFYSVIDRSNLGLQLPGTPQAGQLHPQPLFAALDAVPGTAPPPPAMSGFITPPLGSYNVYLTNAVAAGNQPFTTGGNQVIVYADGKPVTLQANSIIVLGVGANQELLLVNYVNQDGSLNIGGPVAPMTPITKPHAPGELVANSVTGNPGPVNPANPSNPGPFDVLTNPNSPYAGVVPYAKRVR